jgi:hypothetical protein
MAVMAGLLARYLPPGGCFETMSIVDCSQVVEYGSGYGNDLWLHRWRDPEHAS